MKLKRIKAYGFKSFADKLDIEVKSNITAIVGPNGSGKSNIVDAIRWVLGEQSVKSLRGSSAMSDVIFSGSETRGPSKRAEVSLTFDNSEHFLNTDLNEVEIKRILYATGENEYFLNNAQVRLKDITNILLDSGIGNDSFNIIGQGSIDSIINAKPQERRVLIEGAAQVLKYKNRKLESLKKLEKTKDNIFKVDLVINELKSNVEPLKEQSIKAQEYLHIKEELRDLEIALTTYDIGLMSKEYEEASLKVKELNEQKESLEFNRDNEVNETEKLQLDLLKLDEKINDYNNQLVSLNETQAKLASERTLLMERQNYEVDKKRMDESFLKLKEELLRLEKEESITNSALDSLNEEKKKLACENAKLSEDESLINIRMMKTNSELRSLKEEQLSLQNSIKILLNNIEQNVGMPSSVKNVLNNTRLKGIHKTIGQLIKMDEKYELGIDVALGASTNFVVVDNASVASEAIKYLKQNELGRATFFPLNVIKARNIDSFTINVLKDIKGYEGIASDLIEFDEKYRNIIENQLGQVIVATNIDAMQRIAKEIDYKYRIVSLDGEIVHAGGSITGGNYRKQVNERTNRVELDKKKSLLVSNEEKIDILSKKYDDFNKEYESIQDSILEYNKKLITQNELFAQKKSYLDSLKSKIADLNKEIKGIEGISEGTFERQVIAVMEELKTIEVNKELVNKKLDWLKDNKSSVSNQIHELEKKNKEKNASYHKIEQELKNNEIIISKLDTKMDYLLNVLSEDYHLTYDKAKEEYILDIESDLARSKVHRLKKDLERLGDVNVGSISEYERVSTRYNFLNDQRNDLVRSSEELNKMIDEMDEIMKERLTKAFADIEREFSKVFKKLFKGGNGILRLTDPDNILETGIDIVAEPPGKKLNSIALLSGGEKTLTAIALLFAILNVYPVPFCVLDEVEAALDEANVDTFGKYLQDEQEKSEFILITHKKRTMEYAGTLYGITMQEQGVSKVVSVRLEDKK